MDPADSHHGALAPAASFIYATTVVRGRGRFALGLPPLTPPDHDDGWEVCAISCLADGLLVTWRRSARETRGPDPEG